MFTRMNYIQKLYATIASSLVLLSTWFMDSDGLVYDLIGFPSGPSFNPAWRRTFATMLSFIILEVNSRYFQNLHWYASSLASTALSSLSSSLRCLAWVFVLVHEVFVSVHGVFVLVRGVFVLVDGVFVLVHGVCVWVHGVLGLRFRNTRQLCPITKTSLFLFSVVVWS